jgi:hypothetical protein
MRIVADKKAIAGLLDDFKEEANKHFEIAVLNTYLELREATPIDTGEAKDGWKLERAVSVDDIAHIENAVGHIGFLNDGHSQQAPRYFVEQTLMRLGFTFL